MHASSDTADAVREGDLLPDVTLDDQSGAPVRLRAVAETSTVILYFYPLDGSSGCTTQACAIRDSWPLLRSAGVEVFGINPAGADAHETFRGRYGLPFSLLSDEGRQLARAFGFVHPLPFMGGGWSRIERSTVIVDPGGRVRAILRRVKPTAHFDLLRVQLALPDRADDVPAPPTPADVDAAQELAAASVEADEPAGHAQDVDAEVEVPAEVDELPAEPEAPADLAPGDAAAPDQP